MTQQHNDMVAEFHRAFGHPVNTFPTPPSDRLRALRVELIREEFSEYLAAERAGNRTLMLDGLVDTAYVAHGALIAYGMPFRDVPSSARLESLVQWYNAAESDHWLGGAADYLNRLIHVLWKAADNMQLPFDAGFREVHLSNMSKLGADGQPIVRDDGKILKGPDYFAPRLAEIIELTRRPRLVQA